MSRTPCRRPHSLDPLRSVAGSVALALGGGLSLSATASVASLAAVPQAFTLNWLGRKVRKPRLRRPKAVAAPDVQAKVRSNWAV